MPHQIAYWIAPALLLQAWPGTGCIAMKDLFRDDPGVPNCQFVNTHIDLTAAENV